MTAVSVFARSRVKDLAGVEAGAGDADGLAEAVGTVDFAAAGAGAGVGLDPMVRVGGGDGGRDEGFGAGLEPPMLRVIVGGGGGASV